MSRGIPIILHVPHASKLIPALPGSHFCLSYDDLVQELIVMTDSFTDELFELPGSQVISFPISRLVVDPERFRDDSEEPMASSGMGAIYLRTHKGEPLKEVADRESLLTKYYDPHHEALNDGAGRLLAEFGSCLLIDCHSFPSSPLPCDLDQAAPRPDVCIGTDAFHTPPSLAEAMVAAVREVGWSVEVDRPYAGSLVPANYFRKDQRVSSLMIEINRALYMNEATGIKIPSFGETAAKVGALLRTAATTFCYLEDSRSYGG